MHQSSNSVPHGVHVDPNTMNAESRMNALSPKAADDSFQRIRPAVSHFEVIRPCELRCETTHFIGQPCFSDQNMRSCEKVLATFQEELPLQ